MDPGTVLDVHKSERVAVRTSCQEVPRFRGARMALNRYLTGVVESGWKEPGQVASRETESGKSGILETALRFE